MIVALVDAGAICATPAGTVAPFAIAIVLADWIEPAMHVAPSPISLRAAFTADVGVDPSSADSILIVMSLTPSRGERLVREVDGQLGALLERGPEDRAVARQGERRADRERESRLRRRSAVGMSGRAAADRDRDDAGDRENAEPTRKVRLHALPPCS